MGDEQLAIDAFVNALHDRPIQNESEIYRIAGKVDPQNHRLLARAALVHAGEEPASWVDELLTETSREEMSGLYDLTWNIAATSTINTVECRDKYSQALAVAVLCRARPAEKFEFVWGQGSTASKVFPRTYGRTSYRGPLVASPGNRYIWNNHEVSPYWWVNLAGPLAEKALGNSWYWDGYDHPVLGWAMEAAVEHGHDVSLTNEPDRLVPIINKVPCRPHQRWHFIRFASGNVFGLLSMSTHETRGPVLVVEFIKRDKLIRIYSPSRQTGGGQWTACNARLDGRNWAVWERHNSSSRIEGRIADDIVTHVVWDEGGCRMAGDSPPSPDPPDPPDPPPPDPDPGPPQPPAELPDHVPAILQAQITYDRGLRELGSQGKADSLEREARGRTAVEVMARIGGTSTVGNTIEDAVRGCETLLRDLRSMLP